MTTLNNKGKQGFGAVFGVLSVFLLGEAQFVMNPALAAFAAQYPDIPFSSITYLATIPSLIAVPIGVIAGFLIKKGMKYRPLVIIAALIVVVAGVVPYVLHSFAAWIACRVIFGIGFGICVQMAGTLAQRCFSGDMAAKVQGWGATAQNLGGVVLQMLAGIVAARNVDNVWLVHLVLVVPLILVFFTVPEPDDEVPVETVSEQKEKASLGAGVFIKSIGFGFLFMFMYPFLTGISKILENENLGTATLAGTINSAYTVGGMIAGVIFIFIFRKLRKWSFPVFYLMMGLALLAIYVSKSAGLFIFFGILAGIIVFILWSAHFVEFGQTVAPENVGLASGIFVGFTNAFAFLSSPYMGIIEKTINTDPRTPMIIGGFGCLIIGAIYLFATFGRKTDLQVGE